MTKKDVESSESQGQQTHSLHPNNPQAGSRLSAAALEADLAHLETAIRLPGSIQPHGVLLACEPDHLTLCHVSNNSEAFLGRSPQALLGLPLSQVFPAPQWVQITNLLQSAGDKLRGGSNRLVEWTLEREGEEAIALHIVIHCNADGLILLEIVPSLASQPNAFMDFYQTVRDAARALQDAPNFEALCQQMTQEIASLTGFDRILIYQYDAQWHGAVIAETNQSNLDSLLGLHFPDTDTRACRPLYQQHWSRLIPDVQAAAVAIIPDCHVETAQPLDLSHAILRSVSPCHQDYLQNMQVQATLVLSIIHDQQLWGLVSCHHAAPCYFSYELQQACEFLVQVFAVELSSKHQQQDHADQIHLRDVQAQLVAQLTAENPLGTLLTSDPSLLDLFRATGVAVVESERVQTQGQVPEEGAIADLVSWLATHTAEPLFATAHLSQVYPNATAFSDLASGLLAINIAPEYYLLWFRPEQVQTVNWAGNPHEIAVTHDATGQPRLSPRHSFALWQEQVRGQSLPWQPHEMAIAQTFGQAIVKLLADQATILQQLTQKLARSNAELEKFAYIASHDLQEPLNLVSSYVQLLEIRYLDQLDDDARDFINFAVEGVTHMQALIDDLLAYSRVETQGQAFRSVPLQTVFERVLEQLQLKLDQRDAQIGADPLPTVWGDVIQLGQLLQNLLTNALKFCQPDPPQIQLSVQALATAWQFSLQDNGIGIDPEFHERIFLIFQRLHTRDEYTGTGIGLAICKKIVERHGGRIWVESALGQGACFHFTLPRDDAA
ncbi:MAG: ATP-binding protein [Spirulinaceae cyanobacterium]